MYKIRKNPTVTKNPMRDPLKREELLTKIFSPWQTSNRRPPSVWEALILLLTKREQTGGVKKQTLLESAPSHTLCGLTINNTGTTQVGAISKAQKYSRNNYWKDLEFFSKKVFFY